MPILFISLLNFRIQKQIIKGDSSRHPSKLIKFCLHWSMPSAGFSQPPIPQIAPNIISTFSGHWPHLFSNSNHCSNSSFIFACPFGQCHSNPSNSIASDGRTSRHKRMPKNWYENGYSHQFSIELAKNIHIISFLKGHRYVIDEQGCELFAINVNICVGQCPSFSFQRPPGPTISVFAQCCRILEVQMVKRNPILIIFLKFIFS